jgi:hypothetical protein
MYLGDRACVESGNKKKLVLTELNLEGLESRSGHHQRLGEYGIYGFHGNLALARKG